MSGPLNNDIEAWEGEGGAAHSPPPGPCAASMTGTASQVEWAQRIRRRVNDEFDRVAASFRLIADRRRTISAPIQKQSSPSSRTNRAEVMSRERAGYFIHDWQEIGDQVRQMIFQDDRYQKIKDNRQARR